MEHAIGMMSSDDLATAWGCLLREVQRENVAAAKAVLDLLEGPAKEDTCTPCVPLYWRLRRGEITQEEFERLQSG